MRPVNILSLFILLLIVAISCTPNGEEDPMPEDYGNLITGTYQYTTLKAGTETGNGTAIVARDGNNTIRIALQDGVSFTANKLQRVDDDLIMEVPSQQVDYYGMEARFSGQRTISRQGQQYQGVYFGSSGELRISLQITLNNTNDQVLLVLDR
ncbi:hypothetical protein [Cesiribacter andamanensis]|uniref:Lipocalin-like domain-containing protein n=1 Tax=Cesiribacter andamanensis AMV16 TaxID=1279009 RepID=M7NYI9_9BACT|nr:hypothetical protein [Cesiribacter andamanensis]EMR03459.1 hypothetical protein ADICEAN_01392 [Cesiribacter andamanensis AMV16]